MRRSSQLPRVDKHYAFTVTRSTRLHTSPSQSIVRTERRSILRMLIKSGTVSKCEGRLHQGYTTKERLTAERFAGLLVQVHNMAKIAVNLLEGQTGAQRLPKKCFPLRAGKP